MKNLSSLLKPAFAVLAIASACLSFVLMALPTPTIGIMFIALSMFFSLCWWVACVIDEANTTNKETK